MSDSFVSDPMDFLRGQVKSLTIEMTDGRKAVLTGGVSASLRCRIEFVSDGPFSRPETMVEYEVDATAHGLTLVAGGH